MLKKQNNNLRKKHVIITIFTDSCYAQVMRNVRTERYAFVAGLGPHCPHVNDIHSCRIAKLFSREVIK